MRRTVATTTHQSSREIRDLLQSIFALELLDPPPCLWLVSAWVSDAAVLDNSGGEFSALVPAWPQRELVLSEVLAEFLAAETQVVVVTNDHEANRPFRASFRASTETVDARPNILFQSAEQLTTDTERGLHRKRLVTPRMVMWGSMNFTYHGLARNAEDVSVETDAETVARAVNEMEQLYPARENE
jgi:hypothetical protein